ncbi:AsmA family protein [Phytohalomonas tamaricis]|uniref:AsmA family protein n=1 Tax=Phytohalomonas tamaricis TaxID=2081032 RepID=UPI000D0B5E54|nr:DUF748 domain-containing protein [Phytohalomonas tamaricis]
MSETRTEHMKRGRLPSKRWWLPPLIVLGLLGVGLALLPYYLEHRIVEQLSTLTGREVTLEDVDVNPFVARVTLDNIAIAGSAQDEPPVLASKKVVADMGWSSLWQKGWTIEALRFSAPRVRLVWRQNGEWNLTHLFSSSSGGAEASALRIDHLHIDEGQLSWINRHRAQPATLTLEHIALDGQGFNSESHTPFSLTGQAAWNGGTLKTNGKLGFAPWLADLEFSPQGIPLTTFSAYLSSLMQAQVVQGVIKGDIHVLAGQASDAGLKLSADMTLTGLELHSAKNAALARAERITMNDFSYTSSPATLNIDHIDLKAPFLRAIITEQLGTNLTAFTPPASDETPASSQTVSSQTQDDEQRSSTMPFSLSQLSVSQGELQFSDRHLPQPFNVDITALSGQLTGLSTAAENQGKLKLVGQVDKDAPMRIEGTLSPLGQPLSGDLQMHFDHMKLMTFAPYVRQFGGYKVEGGQVNLDLDYRIQGSTLRADNHVVLHRVDLGAPVPDVQTQLPLKKLVAVLQGDDGVINLNIPLQMSLDGASLDIGSVIWQAIGEALENMVTSPGETLSALLGNDENTNESHKEGDQDEIGWMSAVKKQAPQSND